MLKFKKKLYSIVALLFVTYSVWAYSYNPDTYTSCLDDTAQFQDGTQAPVTGYCNITGSGIMDGVEVTLKKCESSSVGPGGANCTGNSVNYVPDIG